MSCEKAKHDSVKMKGLRFRLRMSSWSFWLNVGGGWSQTDLAFWHDPHEFEYTLYRCISLNSFSTFLGGTHPLNHCSDFNASFGLFFDSSHIGVSGTYTIKITDWLYHNFWDVFNYKTYRHYSCYRHWKTYKSHISPCHYTSQKKNNKKAQHYGNSSTWRQYASYWWLANVQA